MERNHDQGLDICLHPSSTTPPPPSSGVRDRNFSGAVYDRQEITIFYNGRVLAFDLTELQARAIILLASRRTGCDAGNKARRPGRLSSPQRLSMTKSLRRFLQDRKRRPKSH